MKQTIPLIIFLAPPGAGKGTIAQQAVEELGFKTISTGNLCRQYKEKDNDLGRALRSYLDQGKFAPDEVVTDMVQDWLQKNADGTPIILDGYPRTERQAESLQGLLPQAAPEYRLKIIELMVSDATLITRLSSRVLCSNKTCQKPFTVTTEDQGKQYCNVCGGELVRRPDDMPDVVKNRIALYHQTINPIKAFYKKMQQSIIVINVENKAPQEVFDLFVQSLHYDSQQS